MDTAKKKAPSNLASLLRTASYLLSSLLTVSTVPQVRAGRWRKSDVALRGPGRACADRQGVGTAPEHGPDQVRAGGTESAANARRRQAH
ncbi:hypothetical protein GCM10012285_52730 [Streptomyces kronopolitis]|uniref:Secreted protein n=1 Tax=Streptomyces kronopolitis TaxID=1612435 RepID=A0ABQ2JU65_9ACTN|nr:hypothetical protein GCM10012285_52730 [Streptomyces kronopolitis]